MTFKQESVPEGHAVFVLNGHSGILNWEEMLAYHWITFVQHCPLVTSG
jgi:hypothetical protein